MEEAFILWLYTETWKAGIISPPAFPEKVSSPDGTSTKPGPCVQWHITLYTVTLVIHTLVLKSLSEPPLVREEEKVNIQTKGSLGMLEFGWISTMATGKWERRPLLEPSIWSLSAPPATVSFVHSCCSPGWWKLEVQLLGRTVRTPAPLKPFLVPLRGCFVPGLACVLSASLPSFQHAPSSSRMI